MSPTDRVSQVYPQTPGSLFVTYDSQGYGESILTYLHMGSDIIQFGIYSSGHILLSLTASVKG
jgi:hypothetical protein